MVWTSMGAQFIKHINWNDLATSGWRHLFPKQSNFKKLEEIWRFILLIRSLFRRWAGRQNLKAVVWENAKTLQNLPYLGKAVWLNHSIKFKLMGMKNSHFNSCLSCLLPPSSYEGRRELGRQLSFWWKTLKLIGHYGIPVRSVSSRPS